MCLTLKVKLINYSVLQNTLHKTEKINKVVKDYNSEIIIDYNKTKGAANTLDNIAATYAKKRKTGCCS